jgi:hypothetical protein
MPIHHAAARYTPESGFSIQQNDLLICGPMCSRIHVDT